MAHRGRMGRPAATRSTISATRIDGPARRSHRRLSPRRRAATPSCGAGARGSGAGLLRLADCVRGRVGRERARSAALCRRHEDQLRRARGIRRAGWERGSATLSRSTRHGRTARSSASLETPGIPPATRARCTCCRRSAIPSTTARTMRLKTLRSSSASIQGPILNTSSFVHSVRWIRPRRSLGLSREFSERDKDSLGEDHLSSSRQQLFRRDQVFMQ